MRRQAIISEGSDAWRMLDELARETQDVYAVGMTERAARRTKNAELQALADADMQRAVPRLLELALTLGAAWHASRPAELSGARSVVVDIGRARRA